MNFESNRNQPNFVISFTTRKWSFKGE